MKIGSGRYSRYIHFIPGIVLLFAVLRLPYSYYQITRWIVFLSSAYYFFDQLRQLKTYEKYCLSRFQIKYGGETLVVLCGAAILFNPIIPFYFSRWTRMILDMIAGILMLCCGCVYFLNFGD